MCCRRILMGLRCAFVDISVRDHRIQDVGQKVGLNVCFDGFGLLQGDLIIVLTLLEEASMKHLAKLEFWEKHGLVYVHSPENQVLLSCLFKGDSGLKLPSAVVPGLKPGPVEAVANSKEKQGFPYK